MHTENKEFSQLTKVQRKKNSRGGGNNKYKYVKADLGIPGFSSQYDKGDAAKRIELKFNSNREKSCFYLVAQEFQMLVSDLSGKIDIKDCFPEGKNVFPRSAKR